MTRVETTYFNPDHILNDLIGPIEKIGKGKISKEGKSIIKEMKNILKSKDKDKIKLINLSKKLVDRIESCCKRHQCDFCQ